MPKVGTVLSLAATNYVEAHPKHLREGIAATLNDIIGIANQYNEDAAANLNDVNFSPQGRAVAVSRTAQLALAKLNTVEQTTIKHLSERAAVLETGLLGKATFTPPTDPAERISHELRMQEIRSQLREVPASERLSIYLTTSDPLVLAAIDSAPMTLSEKRPDGSRRLEPFIDPAQRTAAVLARAERADPETIRTLREVQSLRELYSLAVNGVRAEIAADARVNSNT
jgi:hypothetical protein